MTAGDAGMQGVVRGCGGCREALYVAESVAMTGQLGSMDMVEVQLHLHVGVFNNSVCRLIPHYQMTKELKSQQSLH